MSDDFQAALKRIEELEAELAALKKVVQAAQGNQQPSNPTPTPVAAKVGDKLKIKSISDKTVVTDGSLVLTKGMILTFKNTRSVNVVGVAEGGTIALVDVAPDDTADKAKKLIGTELTVKAIPGVTAPIEGNTDAPPAVGYPDTPTKVGTSSVVVFDNEDWDGGVWKREVNGSIKPGVVMPSSNPLVVAGAVLLFSDGTQATVQSVQVGSPNSSVWLDKRPMPAKVKANNLVTIVSSPYKVPEVVTGEFIPGARGSLLDLVKGDAEVWGNFGQAGGGYTLPGIAGQHYGWGTRAAAMRAKADGLTGVRVSCLAERFTPVLGGEIDPSYGAAFIEQLEMLRDVFGPRSVQVCAAHNYAGRSFTSNAGERVQLGTAKLPVGSFANGLYDKLIPYVQQKSKKAWEAIFGWDWMNEPINLSSVMVIIQEYQLCTNVLRKYDPKGETWSILEAYPWATTVNGVDTIPQLLTVKDPAGKTRFNFHCYFDPDHGGDYVEADSLVSLDVSFMDGVIKACAKAGVPCDFGEMGAPSAVRVGGQGGYNVNTPRAMQALNNGLTKALSNGCKVMLWWYNPDYQANDWDNVNSVTAPRNIQALKTIQQYVR